MFDNNRLRAELAHIHRALGNVAASPGGKGLLDDLRRNTRGTNAARLWQALYADCMRIAYAAAVADGDISDQEIDGLLLCDAESLLGSARFQHAIALALQDFSDQFANPGLVVDHQNRSAFCAAWLCSRRGSPRRRAFRLHVWQIDRKRGALPGLRCERDVASPLVNQTVGARQSQSRARRIASLAEHGIEHARRLLRVPPMPVVANDDASVLSGGQSRR